MKPFTRIKTIKGIDYIYEITPYYDSESKKTRHKSKYLGKAIEGQPVKVREKLPRFCYSYGEFLPFQQCLKELEIPAILKRFLSDADVHKVLILALNGTIHPVALQHIASWFEGTCLAKHYGSVALSSQNLSVLMAKLGSSDIANRVSQALVATLKTHSVLVYDITSISSYSRTIGILEYGYNRDGLVVPQFNFSLVVDQVQGIPIMYDVYPGSIVDMATIANTLKKIGALGIENYTLVLDRGFCTKSNIDMLMQSGACFVMAASMNIKEIDSLVSGLHHEITNPNHLVMYEGKPLFVIHGELKVDNHQLACYCYHDPARQKQEQEFLYKKLYEIKEKLLQANVHRKRSLGKWIADITGNYANYFDIATTATDLSVRIRNKAVAQRVNRMGTFVITYKGAMNWEDCLRIYRGKDIAEKGFDLLKNDMQLQTPGIRSDHAIRGKLFVGFLSLLLKMRLLKKMQDSGLNKHYSLTGILQELQKLKMVELTNGEHIITEQTKKQRLILERLNAVPNSVGV